MSTQKNTKLFAFNLAAKQAETAKPEGQWKVREGVAVAGCSGPVDYDNYRTSFGGAGQFKGLDKGIYC